MNMNEGRVRVVADYLLLVEVIEWRLDPLLVNSVQ
jgi:hypothetical protein